MKIIAKEAPEVVEAFRNLTKAIDKKSVIDTKTKELILLGIFTADKAVSGIDTHVRLALKNGADRNEIVSAILYALPIVGVPSTVLAVNRALEVIGEVQKIENDENGGNSNGGDK